MGRPRPLPAGTHAHSHWGRGPCWAVSPAERCRCFAIILEMFGSAPGIHDPAFLEEEQREGTLSPPQPTDQMSLLSTCWLEATEVPLGNALPVWSLGQTWCPRASVRTGPLCGQQAQAGRSVWDVG